MTCADCKMVQDCVSARSSEFQFGVRRKNGYNPGLEGSELGERTGITLVWQVQRKASSFLRTLNPGRFRVRSKNWAEPWFGRFGQNLRPVPFSELRTLAGSQFGEEPCPTLVRQVRSSEKRQGQTLVRSSEKGLGQPSGSGGSEKDRFLSPNSEEKKKKEKKRKRKKKEEKKRRKKKKKKKEIMKKKIKKK